LCLPRPVVPQPAARLGITPAEVALQWLLQLAPTCSSFPQAGSVAHLRENLAAEGVTLDDEGLRNWTPSASDPRLDERLLSAEPDPADTPGALGPAAPFPVPAAPPPRRGAPPPPRRP